MRWPTWVTQPRAEAHSEAADLYALILRRADTAPARQKVVWLEQKAFESYLCGQAQTSVASWREAIALRHELGDRLEESDDLRSLSHMLLPLGRSSDATEAGLSALRLLEDLGPCPQLAESLVNLAQVSTYTYDPRVAEYADRAITLGIQLGEDAVVLRARGYAALATVLFTNTGWDELEAAWRDAMRADGLAEYAGLIGALTCWTAATLGAGWRDRLIRVRVHLGVVEKSVGAVVLNLVPQGARAV
jgi:hypothetical protein